MINITDIYHRPNCKDDIISALKGPVNSQGLLFKNYRLIIDLYALIHKTNNFTSFHYLNLILK